MLVGPTDSGKTTLSRILTAYAARLDRVPVFLDLDVGQGSSVPGAITAIPVEKTALSIDEVYSHTESTKSKRMVITLAYHRA